MPERFAFSDLRELFAKANEEKSGDQLAGIAARSERERVAAKRRLADLTLDEILQQPLISPDEDNITRCRNTMGERGVLGIRLQPNHPRDDVGGILLATFEGLLYGCGDAVIGINPATDSVEGVSSILSA